MGELSVRRSGEQVTVDFGQWIRIIRLEHDDALTMGKALLKAAGRDVQAPADGKTGVGPFKVTIGRRDSLVVIDLHVPSPVLVMPAWVAFKVANAIIAQAKKAERKAKGLTMSKRDVQAVEDMVGAGGHRIIQSLGGTR